MAEILRRLLLEPPTSVTSSPITIRHHELRDLVVCPEERGEVNYVSGSLLCSQNILEVDSKPRTLCDFSFHPTCLTYGSGLFAAGGLYAELALCPIDSPQWTHSTTEFRGSINNSMFITSACLPQDRRSRPTTRLFVSNNDCFVTAFEVWLPDEGDGGGGCRVKESGQIKLPTAINHSSLSPDGRTLLAVGDTSDVFLLGVTGGNETTMSVNMKYGASDASFSTSWSRDGLKFAVASQDGQVSIWDVRSSRTLASFRSPRGGAATRSIKFSPGASRELLAFTENRGHVHVVDAVTFSSHATYTVPPPVYSADDIRTCPCFEPSPAVGLEVDRALLNYRIWTHQALHGTKPPGFPGRGFKSTEPEITGLSWDPTGLYLYVGTQKSVVEFAVAEPREWYDGMQFA